MVIPEDPPEVDLGYERPLTKRLKTKYQVFDAEGNMVREGRMVLRDPTNLHEAPTSTIWAEWYDPVMALYFETYVYTTYPKLILTEGEEAVFS